VSLTYKQAVALYHQGLDPTVAMLLALEQENTRLHAEIEDLKGTLNAARAVQPSAPSGSVPPYQKPNTARGRRRRRLGRKKGHPGATRARPQHIDQMRFHPALSSCPLCQAPLPQPSEIRQRIIEGLTTQASAATLHEIPRQYCCQCKKMVEPPVVDAMSHDRISLYTYVLTAWLHYRCGMSVSNLVALLAHSGLDLSAGALTQGWQRLGNLLCPAYDQILEHVKTSLVLMADETGWRIRGVTYWLWYFGCQYWSYYVIDRRRGTAVVNRVIGTVFEGVLLVDFWGAYNAIETWAKQRCIFHLFTALEKVDLQRPHDALWRDFRQRVKRLFKDAVRLLDPSDSLDQPTIDRRRQLLADRLDALIAVPSHHKEVRRIQKRLRRHRDELFTFLDYVPLVSPYNNHSEQQMRGPVMCRRISQGNRSLAGAQAQAILMSLFRSMELHGRNPVDEVLRLAQTAVAGKPIVVPLAPDEADQIAA
jgi:transposase